MRPISTAIRQNLNKAALATGRGIYKLTAGKAARSLFTVSTAPCRIKTDVQIIEEDCQGVTIAKTDAEGGIVNRGFRILSTTDLHLGDDPALRKKALQMLKNHIIDTKPDLIVFTGDIILSRFQQLDTIEFARFMEDIGIYWAIVFGNHEAREEKGFFKYLMMKSASDYPHCLARIGDTELFGYGNYVINIKNSEDSLLQSLFFFDSGRDIRDEYREEYGIPDDMKGYDFLKRNQIDMYTDALAHIRERYGNVPSMMYMHIPLKEYEHAICEDGKGGYEFTGECKIDYGKAFESVGSSPFNSGMFDTILREGSTKAVFSGHDHINDYCAEYKGIKLVYNQCCGYETYTMGDKFGTPEKAWPQGVTITDIASDGSLSITRRLNSIYLK